MDPKETNREIVNSELSGTGVIQPISTPLIPTKSIIPSTSPLQKITESSTSPSPEIQKILSKNSNGTEILTSSPNNEAELQLYRVMQRASLLAYYDTLLEMGGDDVQQLCDAGEEEFLEIMALIGMASKPLHVRRLQKALQEWITNPDLFKTPLPATIPASLNKVTLSSSYGSSNSIPNATSAVLSYSVPSVNSTTSTPKDNPTVPMSPDQTQVATVETNIQKEISVVEQNATSMVVNHGMGSPSQVTPALVESQISRLAEAAEALVKTLPQFEPKPHNTKKKICRNLENVMNMSEDDPRRMDEIRKYSAIYGRFDCKRNPQKPLTLHEVSVNEAAAQICRFSPALLTRRDDLFSLARQVVRDSGYQYTKGHSSFKTCNYQSIGKLSELNHHTKKPKVDSACDNGEVEKFKRQERLEQIAEELRILGDKTEELVQAAHQIRQTNDLSSAQSLQQEMEAVQSKQTQLLVEQSELMKQPLPSRFYRRRILFNQIESSKHDTDDTDSQFSLSTASSPSQELGDSRDSLLRDGENSCNTNGTPSVKDPGKSTKQYVVDVVREETIRYENRIEIKNREIFSGSDKTEVISARGGNIIAIANPELSMSCILLKAKEKNGFCLSQSASLNMENHHRKLERLTHLSKRFANFPSCRHPEWTHGYIQCIGDFRVISNIFTKCFKKPQSTDDANSWESWRNVWTNGWAWSGITGHRKDM